LTSCTSTFVGTGVISGKAVNLQVREAFDRDGFFNGYFLIVDNDELGLLSCENGKCVGGDVLELEPLQTKYGVFKARRIVKGSVFMEIFLNDQFAGNIVLI
jgi:hypothetical protein